MMYISITDQIHVLVTHLFLQQYQLKACWRRWAVKAPASPTVSAVVTRRAAASPALTATSGSSTTAYQTALTRPTGGKTNLEMMTSYAVPL